MAAISSTRTATTTTLTPPTTSHDEQDAWGYSRPAAESKTNDKFAVAQSNPNQASSYPHNNQSSTSVNSSYNNRPELATRKMQSVDNLTAARDKSYNSDGLSPPLPIDSKSGRASPAEWPMQSNQRTDDQRRRAQQTMQEFTGEENSKWIHRDKLARIENEELQAAGIFVPRSRAPSKQRRDRSQSRMRRGTETSEHKETRSRKNSANVEPRVVEAAVPSWDLRTPEEIAEEEANAYFTSNGLVGGTRIPVAKTSPAPIPVDYLEHGSIAPRKLPESPEDESILYTTAKTRSRSDSANTRTDQANSSGTKLATKKSASDMSPKKGTGAGRKSSAPSKSPPTPKGRSGASKDSTSTTGTRPPTRSGETKQPEGDPPWLINAYKPDPRLPPDQQLLPTVAKRLQQEQWEKEGKFGDVYDKDFRPLNDTVFLRPPEAQAQDKGKADDETPQLQHQRSEEWPLKPESMPARSPTLRQGSYSTMPKITDKPQMPSSPRPRTPQTQQGASHQLSQQDQTPPRVPQEKDEAKEKGGCGCCVVM